MDWWSEVAVYGPGFWNATQLVLLLTLFIILVSWACGLAAALGKLSKIRTIRAISDFYVWFIRGTPTLIQVFIVYFGCAARIEAIALPGRRDCAWRQQWGLCGGDHSRRTVCNSQGPDRIIARTRHQPIRYDAADNPTAGVQDHCSADHQ